MNIRLVRPEDSEGIRAVYAPYIETAVTFEYELPRQEEFAARVEEISAEYPYLVCEDGGQIVGYAYGHRQLDRAAYQWNAELTIYISGEYTGKGVGRRLYGALLELLALQGIRTVYALVTSPNEKSEGLHRAMGFRTMGVCQRTGYKAGAWRDVIWFEKALAPYDENPAALIPFRDIPAERAEEILRKYR